MGIQDEPNIYTCMEVYGIAKKLIDVIRNEIEFGLHEHKITFKQWQVLHVIGTHKINTPTSIALHLSADKPSITRITDHLVAKLFLKRSRGVDDRRTIQLEQTEEGILVMELGYSAMQNVEVKFKSGLSKSEAKKLSIFENNYFNNSYE